MPEREQFTDPQDAEPKGAILPLTTTLEALRLLSTVKGSRALSLAITKIEEAIMWLEKTDA